MTARRSRTSAKAEPLAEVLARGRFGLVLSAGYFGFFGHAGLLAALEEARLVPAGFSGTSAGALVAAFSAAGLRAGEIEARLTGVRREHFWDPAPLASLLDAARGKGITGLLGGRAFRKLLDAALPVATIEACPAPLVIVTADITSAVPRIHDRGPLAEAIHASCAYPGLFRTVLTGGAQLWDGGLVDKAPLLALTDRVELDALLVHYLPSESRTAPPAPRHHGYVSAMGQALGAIRHEHYVLQAKLCEARGIPVYELSPELTRLGPRLLSRGPLALAEARTATANALAAPALAQRPFR